MLTLFASLGLLVVAAGVLFVRRDHQSVYDLSGEGVSLPLALRRAAENVAMLGETGRCANAECGAIYFKRPRGSDPAENGECRPCALGVKPIPRAKVVAMRRRAK